jgi:hypothetical protein
LLGGTDRGDPSRCNDNINLETDQFGRKIRESIDFPLCKPVLDGDVLPLDVANSRKLWRNASMRGAVSVEDADMRSPIR